MISSELSSLVKRNMIPCRRKYNQALPKLWTTAYILKTHSSSKDDSSINKRSPPHTLEGEELDHPKNNEDEAKHRAENSQLTSDASEEDNEGVIKLQLPNEPLQSDEAVPKIWRYFYILFNHPLQFDLHRSQDEKIQKKNIPM